jgi:hypothetical protein
MRTKQVTGSKLSPQKYANLVGRSPMRMPTAIGKPVWQCTKAELDQLEIWNHAVADLLGRLQESARRGVNYKLGPVERAMMDQHQAHQRALWRWAIG